MDSVQNMCYGLFAFVGWTVTSFLCHQSAKLFLRRAESEDVLENGILQAAIITSIQMMMCFLLTDINLSDAHSPRAQKVMRVKILCHVLATMATNYSMTLVHASSTFAIKLLEPITSAIVQRIVLGTSLSPSAILSLPVIIGGAVTFCGGTITSSSSVLGIVMAFASNIILAFRNVAIKLEQGDSSMKSVQLRSRVVLIGVLSTCLAVVLSLEHIGSKNLVSPFVPFLIVTATSSSVFHVAYSFISTNVVLLYMSVVSHSVANIFKRVLVVLLLYAVGQRTANFIHFIGLVVCALGLLLYVIGQKTDIKERLSGALENSKMSWPSKTARILTACLACMSVFTVGHYYTANDRYISVPTLYNEVSHTVKMIRVPENVSYDDQLMGLTFQGGDFTSYIRDFYSKYNTNADNETIKTFLTSSLIGSPTETDLYSKTLTTSTDIIQETQRIHFNLFTDLLKPYKYAVLFDIAAFENKGDPAITVGEVYLLRRLNIKLLYYCNYYACTVKNLDYVKKLSNDYSPNDLVVLIHGGGNLVGYDINDFLRQKIFARFPNFQKILFPQSIFLKSKGKHLEYCKRLYSNQGNFTMILRDRQSLGYAQEYFSGKPRLMMAPDMAFQIGKVPRFISPSFDILWIKRNDGETPGYKVPATPKGVTLHCADWWAWKTPKGKTTMETAFMMANNGLIFLQRGRVVITDRLHGHILSTLLDIPHVLIDNKFHKLTAYHNTWTRELGNTVIAHNATHAVDLALQLLDMFKDVLPPIAPFMDVEENPK